MRKMILFCLWVILLSACSSQVPQIKVQPTTLDLGDVPNGKIVQREIPVLNEGTAALVIESVSTSCGCTKATISPTTIQPGAEGILNIEFDSGAHGPEVTGELIRQIFIASNDTIQPEVLVELRANVIPPTQ